LGQLKLVLLRDMIVSLGKKIIFGETYVSNFYAFGTISHFFWYMIAAYHWKGVHESYNFVVGSTSIKIRMEKL
jgi:hypothetical protein